MPTINSIVGDLGGPLTIADADEQDPERTSEVYSDDEQVGWYDVIDISHKHDSWIGIHGEQEVRDLLCYCAVLLTNDTIYR